MFTFSENFFNSLLLLMLWICSKKDYVLFAVSYSRVVRIFLTNHSRLGEREKDNMKV